MLEAGEIDPATVEQEYLDARARYAAKTEAGLLWDKRTGLAKQREELDRAIEEDRRLAKRLRQTMPTTPAGAAALIQYILDDDGVAPEEEFWHMAALRSTVAALNKMNGAVQS